MLIDFFCFQSGLSIVVFLFLVFRVCGNRSIEWVPALDNVRTQGKPFNEAHQLLIPQAILAWCTNRIHGGRYLVAVLKSPYASSQRTCMTHSIPLCCFYLQKAFLRKMFTSESPPPFDVAKITDSPKLWLLTATGTYTIHRLHLHAKWGDNLITTRVPLTVHNPVTPACKLCVKHA